MKRCTTALGLLLVLTSALNAQDMSPSPNFVRFSLVVPSNVPLENTKIYTAGAYDSFLREQPQLHAYELQVSSAGVKVIAYLPGCEIDILELTPEIPTKQVLECRPLQTIKLSGKIIQREVLIGKVAEIEIHYMAYWAHEFAGTHIGIVPEYRVAKVTPDNNGAFDVLLPDFARDAVSSRWKGKGKWRIFLREVATGNTLATLKPSELTYDYDAKSSIVIPKRWREIITAYEVVAPTAG